MLFLAERAKDSRNWQRIVLRTKLALSDVIQAHNGKASALAPRARVGSPSRLLEFATVLLARRLGVIKLQRIEDGGNKQHQRHARDGDDPAYVKDTVGRAKHPCIRMKPQRHIS